MQMNNKTILITGGTSGIGLELVRALVPHNQIIVLARNPAKLIELQQQHPNLHCYKCNLTNLSDLQPLLADIHDKHQPIHTVINNAAIQTTPTVLDKEFTIGSIEEEITLNLMVPIWISAIMLRRSIEKKQPCAIINIGSGLAFYPKRQSAVYCATKAGLHSFSRSLRYQTEKTYIKIHEVILPLVNTPMTAGRTGKKLSAVQAAKEIIAGINKDKNEIYVGKAKWIPLLSWLCPPLLVNILKRS